MAISEQRCQIEFCLGQPDTENNLCISRHAHRRHRCGNLDTLSGDHVLIVGTVRYKTANKADWDKLAEHSALRRQQWFTVLYVAITCVAGHSVQASCIGDRFFWGSTAGRRSCSELHCTSAIFQCIHAWRALYALYTWCIRGVA